jgi:hypothetical protein
MSVMSRLGTVCLLGTGLVTACGARTGLLVPGFTSEPIPGPDAGPEACVPQSIVASQDVPNMYFVLDHSGSMKENNKWPTMRSVVSSLMNTLGSSARFGATMFPNPATDVCDPGVEVLPLQLGDSAGNLASQLLAATAVAPSGGTPTAGTLTNLLPELTGFMGPTFAILATDGGANCDPNLTCALDQCTANLDGVDPMCQPFTPPNCCTANGIGGPEDCLDTQATVDAAAKLYAAGVPVYVIGILGSAPYEQMLDQLAQAGGTARPTTPYYYRVDTADANALEAVLAQIATKITASCMVTLASVPADPSTIVVEQGGVPVPEDPNNGWQLTGMTLTLHGSSCQRLLSGQALGLTVTDGCQLK